MDYTKLTELVVQAQQGDNTALSELYGQTYNPSYFYALKLMGNEHDALDVMQNAYIIMVEKIGAVKEPQTFFVWFKRVLTNECNRALGKKSRTVLAGDEEQDLFENIEDERTEFLPADVLDDKEKQRIIFEALDNDLSPAQKQTVLLFYYDELKLSEIAEITETNENAVKNRLFESRRKLKASLEKYRKQGVLAVVPIPLFTRLLKQAAEQNSLSPELAGSLLQNVSNSTGVSLSYSAAGTESAVSTEAVATAGTKTAVKAAGMSVKTKIAACLAAVAVLGGITAVVLLFSKGPGTTAPTQGEADSTTSSGITSTASKESDPTLSSENTAPSSSTVSQSSTPATSTSSTGPSSVKPSKAVVFKAFETESLGYSDGWIYYLYTPETGGYNFDDTKLYRMKPDGTGKQPVSFDVQKNSIFAIEGGWFYYIVSQESYAVYKSRADGTDKQKLTDNVDACVLRGEWIYYPNTKDDYKMYKVNINGTGVQKITDDKFGKLTASDGWVYYINSSDSNKLYKVSADGKNRQKLTDDALYIHAPVAALNGWVYYVNKADDSVYRISADGTGRQKLSEGGMCLDLFSDGSNFYYTEMEESACKTYIMNFDGTGKKLLYSGDYDFGYFMAFVIGDTLYCNEDGGQ